MQWKSLREQVEIKKPFFFSFSTLVQKIQKMSRQKRFLYNPDDPKRSFDVYIDKNPRDTIPIRYKTIDDVKQTIRKLEQLYRQKKYPHKRIWQVAMIMKVRLGVLRSTKPDEYRLASYYLEFLSIRTSLDEESRREIHFKI